MRTGSLFLRGGSLATCLLVIFATSLAIAAQPELTADEQNDPLDVRIKVYDEVRNPIGEEILILCWADGSGVQKASWDSEGGFFALRGLPGHVKEFKCRAGFHEKYESQEHTLFINGQSEIPLTVRLKTIPTLGGVITAPSGKPIPGALVMVVDASGKTVVNHTDQKGQFQLEHVKAGPATVRYLVDGYAGKSDVLTLSHGANLSTALRPATASVGLLLLLPGLIVLGVRAVIDPKWGERAASHAPTPSDPQLPTQKHPDPNAVLIIASLASWGLIFLILGLQLWVGEVEQLTFFDAHLSFSLFVPACGFLGALVFVIDIFQGGRQDVNTREFAMRLVLAPYVAIIVVIFVGGTFTSIRLDNVQAQAALAFFSGFLVVLFLQGLTERGNEILGKWRSDNRYEPSEIAKTFKLDREEDLKLRKTNLRYLIQLQALPEDELRVLGRQTELGEGFLIALKRQLSPDHLQAQLGPDTWAHLNKAGLTTIWDVALLTPGRLGEISQQQHIDQDVLTRFYQKCQVFVKDFGDLASRAERAAN